MMKCSLKTGPFIIFSFLLGCETSQKLPEINPIEQNSLKTETSELRVHLEQEQKPPYLLTGRNVFIAVGGDDSVDKNCAAANTQLAEFRKTLSINLESHGFKITTLPRKAHSQVFLACHEAPPIKSMSATSRYENGMWITKKTESEMVRKSFLLIWTTHEYGFRQKFAFNLSISTDQESWDDFLPKAILKANDEFAALNMTAPKEDLKMAGDPGCQPRFGFEAKLDQDDSQKYRVTEILPNSPAKISGLKVGDEIVAIDSIAYDNKDFPDTVYQTKIPIPLKFVRNGKVIRSSILPKIVCP